MHRLQLALPALALVLLVTACTSPPDNGLVVDEQPTTSSDSSVVPNNDPEDLDVTEQATTSTTTSVLPPDDVSGEDDFRLEDLLGLRAGVDSGEVFGLDPRSTVAFLGSEQDARLRFESECGVVEFAVSQVAYSFVIDEVTENGCEALTSAQQFQADETFNIITTREPGSFVELVNGDASLVLLQLPGDAGELVLVEDGSTRTYVLPDE